MHVLSHLRCLCAEANLDTESQMQLLFAELKRIEGQQQQLKTAVAQNRVLVVHPPKGFEGESEEDEYAEEKVVKPDPDRFVPSGTHSSALRLLMLFSSNPCAYNTNTLVLFGLDA